MFGCFLRALRYRVHAHNRYAYGYNKRSLRPCRLLVAGLPPGGLVEQGLRKHAGSDSWLAMASSHAPLRGHLPSLRSCGASLGARRAAHPAAADGPAYFLNPAGMAAAAEQARKRAAPEGAVVVEGSATEGAAAPAAEGASPEGTGAAAAKGGDKEAAAAPASSEAAAAAASSAAAAPTAAYVFDPLLAQAVWDQEAVASAAAVAAAEQPPWPCPAEVYYLTADAEEELSDVPWHPGVV